ncbi:MAG: phosphatidylserine decarboxylase family protein [Desulfobacteraceae bacterium]|nr:MAG: phosphatidylserine decarboxylase family protein [Desulfobacteraceae bacterium]
MRIPVARQGAPIIAVGLVLVILFGWLGSRIGLSLAGLFTVFAISFFRDPERVSPRGAGVILAPADGRVLLVEEQGKGPGAAAERTLKISIFMSVFNCHVNRIPLGGVVEGIDYRPGKFFAAHQDRASRQNEQNILRLKTDKGDHFTVVQIAGLIARRIVCWVRSGDRVGAGDRFGLIQFGSRVDLYLPLDSRITIKRGDRTKAGLTVVGYVS